jgi:DNA-directed RNA polymerase subunit RPC12/RpoP
MAATTYECSECGALLKSPQELAAGKKIRCPKCSKVFTIGGAAAATSAVAGKASAAAASKPAPPPAPAKIDDEEDEGGSYIFKEDNAPPPPTDAELNRGNKKKREDDEDDDDLDEDDKPRKKKKKGGKKKKATSGGGGSGGRKAVLIIAGILVVLLLGSSGAGAYLYLNWYKNRGSGKEDPLALLPADCNVLMYVNYGSISSHPSIAPLLERAVNTASGATSLQQVKAETGIDAKDLFDQIYYGFKVTGGQNESDPPMTVVFRSKVPFDQAKIRSSSKVVSTERSGWKTYFKVEDKNGRQFFLYMPSNRFIMFTTIPETDLHTIMASKGIQPTISPDLLSFAQNLEKEDVWIAGSVNEKMREQMKSPEGMPPGVPMASGVEAGIAKAKAFGMGATLTGSQAKFVGMVDCGSDSTAKKMSDDLEGMWNKMRGMLSLAASMKGKSSGDLVKELTQSLRFASKGSFANVSAQVSIDSLKDLINEGMQAGQASQQQPAGRLGNRGPGPAGNRGPGAAGNRGAGPAGRRGGRGNDK